MKPEQKFWLKVAALTVAYGFMLAVLALDLFVWRPN